MYKRMTFRYLVVAIIIYVFVTILYYQDSLPDSIVSNGRKVWTSGPLEFSPDRYYFKLFDALSKYEPLPRPDIKEMRGEAGCHEGDISGASSEEVLRKASYQNLDSCMHPPNELLDDLKKKHTQFVEKMHLNLQVSPEDVKKLWPNERGIVTIGGGRFSVISISMLETLREMNSTLPVEVIVPPEDEGDDDYCDNVLPKLNAKCVFFSDVLPQDLISKLKIERYQYKLIGLLISSFREVLFLDADSLPLENIDRVFDKPLFKEKGLILWPDMWRRATTPAFYKVAGIEYDLSTRVRYMGDDISPISRYEDTSSKPDYKTEVPMHDLEGFIPDLSSESGQLLMNKVEHLSTLILATYYNVHSRWYYRMLSQGTSGEGDKETFVAAAYALNMTYYQVKTKLTLDGYRDHNADYHGISLYQHNFQQDYDQYQRAKRYVEENLEEFSVYNPKYSYNSDFMDSLMKPTKGNNVGVMFAHISYHKFDPYEMATEDIHMNKDREHFRAFTRYDVLKGFDLELFNYKAYQRYLCSPDSLPIDFKYYREKFNNEERNNMCKYLDDRVEFLNQTHQEYLGNS